MTWQEEQKIKIGRLQKIMEEKNLDAIYIKRQDNFAWLTCGGINYVGLGEMGNCGLLVTRGGDLYAITNNIEAPRMRDEEKLEEIEICGDPEDAETLKILLGNLKGMSIFGKLATTLYWVAKKVARKLRQWFKVDEEGSVLGAICRSLSGLGSILRAGVKLVWNATKFAVSFIVAGALKIFDVIKSIVVSIKNWVVEKYNKFTNKDVIEDFDDDIIDEEIEEELEAEVI